MKLWFIVLKKGSEREDIVRRRKLENSEIHLEPRNGYRVKWLINVLGIKGKSEEGGVMGVSLGFCRHDR